MKSINKCNERIAQELGRTPAGDPIFMWKWSDNLYHMMPTGDYDYESTPGSVIVLPRAILQKRLAAPHLRRQWVLCRWLAPSMPRSEWEQAFGTRYAWPGNGEWVPTNIALPEGYTPGDPLRCSTFNDRLIGIIKEQLAKTLKQLADDAEEGIIRKEQAASQLISDAIDDAMPKVGRFVPPANVNPAPSPVSAL